MLRKSEATFHELLEIANVEARGRERALQAQIDTLKLEAKDRSTPTQDRPTTAEHRFLLEPTSDPRRLDVDGEAIDQHRATTELLRSVLVVTAALDEKSTAKFQDQSERSDQLFAESKDRLDIALVDVNARVDAGQRFVFEVVAEYESKLAEMAEKLAAAEKSICELATEHRAGRSMQLKESDGAVERETSQAISDNSRQDAQKIQQASPPPSHSSSTASRRSPSANSAASSPPFRFGAPINEADAAALRKLSEQVDLNGGSIKTIQLQLEALRSNMSIIQLRAPPPSTLPLPPSPPTVSRHNLALTSKSPFMPKLPRLGSNSSTQISTERISSIEGSLVLAHEAVVTLNGRVTELGEEVASVRGEMRGKDQQLESLHSKLRVLAGQHVGSAHTVGELVIRIDRLEAGRTSAVDVSLILAHFRSSRRMVDKWLCGLPGTTIDTLSERVEDHGKAIVVLLSKLQPQLASLAHHQ